MNAINRKSKVRVAILQSNYIPWKGYFDMVNSVDKFVIYDEVQYTKNDWRNRNLLKTRNGTEWITIPVRHLYLGQRIDEVEVFNDKWNKKHWSMIQGNYARAAAFPQVAEYFKELYLSSQSRKLSEINLRFIDAVAAFLGIKTQLIDSRELDLKGDRNERLVDACRKLGASTYLSGPAAKDYLDVSLFKQNGVSVEWMDYSGYPEYPQLFSPFVAGVSILDLIFNCGRDATRYMKSFNNEPTDGKN